MDMKKKLNLSFGNLFKKYFLLVVLSGIFCGAGGLALSLFAFPKSYESHALIYVESGDHGAESTKDLVNTCRIIFKSATVLDNLIANLDLPYTKNQLNEMIEANAAAGTGVIELVVRSGDAQESRKIVNELLELSVQEFARLVKSGTVEIVDYGSLDTEPLSEANVPLIVLAAFLGGIIISCTVVILCDMFDSVIRSGDDISEVYGIPVFAEIPEFNRARSGKLHKNRYSDDEDEPEQENVNTSANGFSEYLLSDDSPFSAAEAYNYARTNVIASVSKSTRKIVAVTSSNNSEGKSTVCSNIAICFANAGHKVLLVECDLRKPAIAAYFGISPEFGLSSVLDGLCNVSKAINENAVPNLDIISAGNIPKEPSKLIGSDSMRKFLEASAESYDYVFLDTPAVSAAADSQLMNDVIAGFVFVVKENSTAYPDVKSALDKIHLENGNVLGFVKTFSYV